jgi:hypothetical protein
MSERSDAGAAAILSNTFLITSGRLISRRRSRQGRACTAAVRRDPLRPHRVMLHQKLQANERLSQPRPLLEPATQSEQTGSGGSHPAASTCLGRPGDPASACPGRCGIGGRLDSHSALGRGSAWRNPCRGSPKGWHGNCGIHTHNLKVIGSDPIRDLDLSIRLRCAADPFDR